MKKQALSLVGNPNCGKTTLFNILTGLSQKVGNWPGVTVEQKRGVYNHRDCEYELVDLPGCYSTILTEDLALDEQITSHYLLSNHNSIILNVVDATKLQRDLYLSLQLREQNVPMILVVNCIDKVKDPNFKLDILDLKKRLNCPVVPISAKSKDGIIALKVAIANYHKTKHKAFSAPYMPEQVVSLCTNARDPIHRACMLRALEGCLLAKAHLADENTGIDSLRNRVERDANIEIDILLATGRHKFIGSLICRAPIRDRKTFGSFLDKIILNRALGVPVFFSVMYMLFVFAIAIGGGIFQEFFDLGSQAIFMDLPRELLQNANAPNWVVTVIADGIGQGINITASFIPVIMFLFLGLSFLESSGYIARAAFVMDRALRSLGLPGKALIPMIVGFGCNVPAVMGARTLESHKERILTIMMTPFMSCSARLAIYAVFVAAFFPTNGHNVIFGLYLIGVIIALATGYILRKTILNKACSPLVMELPAYQLPTLKGLWLQTWHRLKRFLAKAGSLIIPLCVLLGTLNHFQASSISDSALGFCWKENHTNF